MKKEVEDKKKLENEADKLELELITLKTKQKRLKEALNDKEMNEEDKQKVLEQLAENKVLQDENTKKFVKNQADLKMANSKSTVEVSEEQIEALRDSIRKCNFACRLLISGKSINEVQLSLEQWKDRKLTRTKPEKATEEKPASEKPVEEKPVTRRSVWDLYASEKPNEEKPETDPHPVEVSEFDKKHPRLAKIKNFFVKGWEKFQNWRKGEEPKPEIKPEIKPETKPEIKPEVEGKQTTEQMNARKAEFYKRIGETGRVSGTPKSQEIKGWSTTPVVQTQEDNEPEQ